MIYHLIKRYYFPLIFIIKMLIILLNVIRIDIYRFSTLNSSKPLQTECFKKLLIWPPSCKLLKHLIVIAINCEILRSLTGNNNK